MTSNNDDLFKGLTGGTSTYATGTNPLSNRPYFGIDPTLPNDNRHYVHNSTQWESTSSIPSNTLTAEVYRTSFKGQLETLTQIVSDNADYLIKQIQIEVGPKDTHVYIPIRKAPGIPPKFTFPTGEMNHSIAKKYMDWLAMVQLILQDG